MKQDDVVEGADCASCPRGDQSGMSACCRDRGALITCVGCGDAITDRDYCTDNDGAVGCPACFTEDGSGECWNKAKAALSAQPCDLADVVEAKAREQADHWLDDMQTKSLDAKHVSLMAMARNCIHFGKSLSAQPASDLADELEAVSRTASSLRSDHEKDVLKRAVTALRSSTSPTQRGAGD